MSGSRSRRASRGAIASARSRQSKNSPTSTRAVAAAIRRREPPLEVRPDLRPVRVDDRVAGRVADPTPGTSMWLRKIPSNVAGSAASAARERSLRASVLNSTRMQPSSSNASPSISSFASMLAPVSPGPGAARSSRSRARHAAGGRGGSVELRSPRRRRAAGDEAPLLARSRRREPGVEPGVEGGGALRDLAVHPCPDLWLAGDRGEVAAIRLGDRLEADDRALERRSRAAARSRQERLGVRRRHEAPAANDAPVGDVEDVGDLAIDRKPARGSLELQRGGDQDPALADLLERAGPG